MDRASVVLDTNIFVAAGFNPLSAAAKIVDAVKNGKIRLVWDEPTRGEIEHILMTIPPLRAYRVAELFREEDRFNGKTQPKRFSAISDPDDRKFAALAEAAGAVLISNDGHLLCPREDLGLKVLTPGEFYGA